MSQAESAKLFLAALLALENNSQTSSTELERHLASISTALKMEIPFPQPLAQRLLVTLVLTFRKLSKLPSTEADLLHQSSPSKGSQEYLLICYTSLLHLTVTKLLNPSNIQPLSQIVTILVATVVDKIKHSQSEYFYNLLLLLRSLVQVISRGDIGMVETVFPNVVSSLFNYLLKYPSRAHKCSNVILECLGEIIGRMFEKAEGVSLVNPILLESGRKEKSFKEICLQRVTEYVDILATECYNYASVTQMKPFILKLIQAKGLFNQPVSNHLYKMSYFLQFDIPSSQPLIQSFMKTEVQKSLKLISRSITSLDVKEIEIHVRFVSRILSSFHNVRPSQVRHILYLLKPLFKVAPNRVQTTVGTIVPFPRLTSDTCLKTALEQDLSTTNKFIRRSYLCNCVILFTVKQSFVEYLQTSSLTWSKQLCHEWALSLVEDLESSPYSPTMAIQQMHRYLCNVVVLKLVVKQVEDLGLVGKILEVVKRSECLVKLTPTLQEEELLIIMSHDILAICCAKMVKSVPRGIRRLNYAILMVEVTVGLLVEETYSITAASTHHLLKLSQPGPIGAYLSPLLPTLITRNRHNLPFIQKLIELSSTHLTHQFSEYLFQQFYLSNRASTIIFLIMPHLSPTTLRQAILCISQKSKWIDALSKSLTYLNNQATPTQQSFPFNPNDPSNVVVKNCLGVVLMEIKERFKMEMAKSPHKVLDLLGRILELNPQMVFCSTIHEYFGVLEGYLECKSVNQLTFSRITIINKVVFVLCCYLCHFHQLKKTQILESKTTLLKTCEKLFGVLQNKMEMEDSMQEVVKGCAEGLGRLYERLEKIK